MPTTFVEHELPNGLRIICEVMPSVSSVAVGFCARTGARHETPDVHGVSHFLEHMCFKGTPRRSSRDVNVRFDELGSIYNAYTGKEHTVYFGWVPARHDAAQLELLADMLRPALRAEDYETERNVILEEIAMSEDSFEHCVLDFLHQTVFAGHSLGHEILGEAETIRGLPRERMVAYHRQRYAADNVLLIVAGAVEPEAVFAAAARCCADWERSTNGKLPVNPPLAVPAGVHKRLLPQFKQQSLVVVYPGVRSSDPAAEDVEAFVTLFGGANSRCFWNIVQKGVCAQAGAAWLGYEDCGVLALYADGDPEQCEAMLAALRAQAAEVSAQGFRPDEIQRVKNQRRTHLALEGENPRTRMMQLIDDLDTYGRPRTMETRLAEVDAVTAKSIARHLERYPITGEGMLCSVGPRDWP